MTIIHEELNKSLKWYRTWHNNPGHHFAHWLIFVLVSLTISSYISGDIIYTYNFEEPLMAQSLPIGYQSICKPGEISVAGASASVADPTSIAELYCDNDPVEAKGVTFPVTGYLTCGGTGNIFIQRGYTRCQNWTFDENGTPTNVDIIFQGQCPGPIPVTITEPNISIGAWVVNPRPAVETAFCVPGIAIPPKSNTVTVNTEPEAINQLGGSSSSSTTPLTDAEQLESLDKCNTYRGLDKETHGFPIICDFAPSTVKPGDTLTVVGINLGTTIYIANSSGTVIPIQGTLSDLNTKVTFTIPSNLVNGDYGIEISSGLSVATTPNNKLIKVDRNKGFVQQNNTITAPTYSYQKMPAMSLGQLISNIYLYSLQFLGIIILLMIIFSGFQWLTAGGNTGIITKARSRIWQALLGGLILLSSYLILTTINPDLVGGEFTLEDIDVPKGGKTFQYCNPACPAGQYCIIDPATNLGSCKINPGLLGNCDPMNVNSCPSGQSCILDLSTSTATCKSNQ